MKSGSYSSAPGIRPLFDKVLTCPGQGQFTGKCHLKKIFETLSGRTAVRLADIFDDAVHLRFMGGRLL
jgi:hypothetical protein